MNALHRLRGFSLVEVTLALGIAAFCLVAVFGLLSVGLNTSNTSVEQTIATNFLSSVASDLRTAPNPPPTKGQATTTTVYKIAIPATSSTAGAAQTQYLDANGQPTTSLLNASYDLTVQVQPGAGRNAAIAHVTLSWPATPTIYDTVNSSANVEALVALDRN